MTIKQRVPISCLECPSCSNRGCLLISFGGPFPKYCKHRVGRRTMKWEDDSLFVVREYDNAYMEVNL